VVVGIEVLEHVLDPVGFTRWIHRKLKPGGMVFLTTPNSYSKAYYPPKPNTAILCPMDHLNLFSCQTLPRLLSQNGFHLAKLETDGPDGLQLQAFAFKTTGR
jgi:Methyltransferase domain